MFVRCIRHCVTIALLGIAIGAVTGCALLKGTAVGTTAQATEPPPPSPDPIVEPPVAEPAATASDSVGVARLVRIAALWETVRLFHPAVVTRGVEWDSAVVRALPALRSARKADDYAAALRSLLAKLGDNVTRVEVENTPETSSATISDGLRDAASMSDSASSQEVSVTRTTDGVFVVTVPDPWALQRTTVAEALRAALNTARTAAPVASPKPRAMPPAVPPGVPLVLDLRTAAPSPSRASRDNPFDAVHLAQQLAIAPLVTPALRHRVHESKIENDSSVAQPGFTSQWRVSDGLRLLPEHPETGRGAAMPRLVIVANRFTPLSRGLLALVASRQALLVAEEGVDERPFIPTVALSMGTGVTVQVRVAELINADGTTGITPDTVVNAPHRGDSSPERAPSTTASAITGNTVALEIAPALRAALKLVRTGSWPRPSRGEHVAVTPPLLARTFDSAWYPTMGARLLGAFRIWAALRDFHAYRDLYDEDLDAAFARLLPRFEAARDSVVYARTVADLASTMDDAQGEITGPMMTSIHGVASAPLRARFVEGRAIITQLASDSVARAFNLSVGDEITAADGFPVSAWMNEHRRLAGASNEWTRQRQQMAWLSRGPQGSADYRIRDAAGKERVVTLPRSAAYRAWLDSTDVRTQPVWRELPGNIGYIDLDRLTAVQADSAFAAVHNMRALVLDLRGTVRVGLAALWPRLVSQPRFSVAKLAVRMATAPCIPFEQALVRDRCEVVRRNIEPVVTADTSTRFRGRLVLLIDERTQGMAERLALGLESGAGAVFVGSTSAGASGDVATLWLPGELSMRYSAVDVRHADGRQLQRVGLTPQVEAHPTVRGIRSGADDVLDRAQQYLGQLLDPPARRRK